MKVEGFKGLKSGKFSFEANHIEIKDDHGRLIGIAMQDSDGVIIIAHAQEPDFASFINKIGLGDVHINNIVNLD